jgi:hypothetical protein
MLGACASGSTAAFRAHVDSIKTLEVYIDVPSSNFVIDGSDPLRPLLVTGGVPTGVAGGAGVAAVPLTMLANYVNAAPGRAAAAPVGKTISDIELKQTVFQQLQQSRQATGHGPVLVMGTRARPTAPEFTQEAYWSNIEFVKATTADAVLLLRLTPNYWVNDQTQPNVVADTRLMTKSGEVIQHNIVRFVGPEHRPGMGPLDSPEALDKAIDWWAQSRYRRFLLQGIRGALLPVSTALFEPPLSPAAIAKRDAPPRLRSPFARNDGIRSGDCFVEADDAVVYYRIHRDPEGRVQIPGTLVAAYCPREKVRALTSFLDEDLEDNQSWVVGPLTPPPVPVTVRR